MITEIVRVYRNLHKSKAAGCPVYSIWSKRSKKVVAHSSNVIVSDAKFLVSQAGRERVLRDQRKNVHAFVEGRLLSDSELDAEIDISKVTKVTYNPYLYKHFVDLVTGDPIYSASVVQLERHVIALIA